MSPARSKGLLATAVAVVFALLAVGAPATAVEVGTGPGVISGTVTTSDGQPVEGATIHLGGPSIAGVSTDAEGNFEASGLEVGYYFGTASLPLHQQAPSQEVTLTEELPTATLDFVLEPYAVGVGTISGTVTADGAPLADWTVSAWENLTGQNVYSTTDENGFYSFSGLATGDWNVYIWFGESYQSVFVPPVSITAAEPDVTVDLALLSWPVGSSSIVGVVTDAETGQAISGAHLYATGIDVAHS